MPGLHRAVEVKLPEAELLADLYGIEYDLSTASYLCSKAIEFWQPQQKDYLVIEALISEAIVRYCRCFSSGARLGLRRKDIEELNAEDLSAHNYFKALRDKFVAHSVNPFEESYVTASTSERDGVKFPIQSINPGYHRLVLSNNQAEALASLIGKVRTIVTKLVESERDRLLAVIQSLPLEVIHSGDLHTQRRFNAADVNKSRKQSRDVTIRSTGQRTSKRARDR